MTETIENTSGMNFSPLFENSKFQSLYIEKTMAYSKLKPKGVDSVEFVVKKKAMLYFVEAKTNFLNVKNVKNNDHAKVNEEISELYNKFTHSFFLFMTQKLGIAQNKDSAFQIISITSVDIIIFFLIVKDFEQEWCSPLRNKIEKEFRNSFHPLNKMIKFKVVVINSEVAKKQGLIA